VNPVREKEMQYSLYNVLLLEDPMQVIPGKKKGRAATGLFITPLISGR
jgi:hypothetical protein